MANYHWQAGACARAVRQHTLSQKKKQIQCCINVIAGSTDSGEYRPPNTLRKSSGRQVP